LKKSTITDDHLNSLLVHLHEILDPASVKKSTNKTAHSVPHEDIYMRLEANRIPITIIGGDFGCGKTTLLNTLLRGKHGLRLAVLINDFGSINIDAQLVERQNDDVIALGNGCICRSIGESFVRILTELVESSTPPEHIILEASGVSDLGKIYQYVMAVHGLRPGGIIILADAETIRKRSLSRTVGTAVTSQLKMADLLILNKIDLVKEEQRVALRAWLQGKVPKARFIETSYGVVPAFIMLGLDSSQWSRSVAFELAEHDRAHHNDMYETWSYISEYALEGNAFRSVMDALPPNILRAKGVLYLKEDLTRRTIFQLVGERWSLERYREWSQEPRSSRLVILGLRNEIANSYVKKMMSINLRLSIVK
jgi:G3E family GTPase